MNPFVRKSVATLFLLLASYGSLALAGDPVRTVYDIELEPDARIEGGKSAFLQGTATAYGHQFQVLDTQLDQPISVGLYTRDPAHPLYLRVVKDDFTAPVRELQTDANGRIDLHFRTYDGFKLWVAASEPTDYQLVVWAGDEQVVAAPPAVVPASEYVEPPAVKGVAPRAEVSTGSWSGREIGLAAILGLVLLLGGGMLFLRRKPAGDRR
jgi:hypothetical protein